MDFLFDEPCPFRSFLNNRYVLAPLARDKEHLTTRPEHGRKYDSS